MGEGEGAGAHRTILPITSWRTARRLRSAAAAGDTCKGSRAGELHSPPPAAPARPARRRPTQAATRAVRAGGTTSSTHFIHSSITNNNSNSTTQRQPPPMMRSWPLEALGRTATTTEEEERRTMATRSEEAEEETAAISRGSSPRRCLFGWPSHVPAAAFGASSSAASWGPSSTGASSSSSNNSNSRILKPMRSSNNSAPPLVGPRMEGPAVLASEEGESLSFRLGGAGEGGLPPPHITTGSRTASAWATTRIASMLARRTRLTPPRLLSSRIPRMELSPNLPPPLPAFLPFLSPSDSTRRRTS